MSASTQELIAQAYRGFVAELPALEKLKLVIKLELRGRSDIQVYEVRTPGPEIAKREPEGARVQLSIPRSHFNELAADGKLSHWHEAWDAGHIKAGGDPDVLKLLGTVIGKHEARTRLKRVR